MRDNREVRVVVQRVSSATVSVADEVVGRCGVGLAILVGIAHGDTDSDAERLAGKVARLRVFPDDHGRFDRSLLDIGGEALVVSQFTLLADTERGNRPSFARAAEPTEAEAVVERFTAALADHGIAVASGRFRAHMTLELQCDGPVTIVLGGR